MKKSILIIILFFTTNIFAQSICFDTTANYNIGTYLGSMCSADFNEDGHPDLAVTRDSNVAVLLGSPTGTFSPAVNYKVGNSPTSICFADFNNDGHKDIAVTVSNNSYAHYISLLTGTGLGTFNAALTYTTVLNPQAICAADFNDDGKFDVIVNSQTQFDSLYLIIGNGDGTFMQPNYISFYGNGICSSDFNNDGHFDLAIFSGPPEGSFSGGGVSVLLGIGNGTFTTSAGYSLNYIPNAACIADFNNDGKPDLAVSCGGNPAYAMVLIGNGDGTFGSANYYSVDVAPYHITSVDFNGDGYMDLITSNYGALANNVSILLANSNGTFASAIDFSVQYGLYPYPEPEGVCAEDFNGDNKADFATANVNGYVSVRLQCGTLGINEITNKTEQVKVYPNPANTTLNVFVSSSGVENITMSDILGNLIQTSAIKNQNPVTLDLSALSNGIYFIKIGNQTQKFIKN